MKKKWYRSRKDKMIGGVAGGLAEYFDIDPTIVRILFVVGLFMGAGFLAYIVLWIVVPEEPYGLETAQQTSTNSGAAKETSDQNAESQTAEQAQAQTQHKQNSSHIFAAILIVFGVLLLIDNFVHFHAFWPLLLILIGVGILLKSKYD
ncbi:MAG: PspC domain-containing protein [Ignavibacteriaceae bacterium]